MQAHSNRLPDPDVDPDADRDRDRNPDGICGQHDGVPIGTAISNSGAYVMDPQQRLVPLGVVGELVVTGDGLARGYTDPSRDEDRFVSVVIEGEQVRAYRTGDRVCYRPDGQLDFLGRLDGQIKIRGQRVELGEIEHVIRSHAAVEQVVAAVHNGHGAVRVVAFVNLEDNVETDGEEIKSHLEAMAKHTLPSYMVPEVVLVARIPLNASGKVDRMALLAAYRPRQRILDAVGGSGSPKEQPETDDERRLQWVWAAVLRVEPPSLIGRRDGFFQLGGDSMAAMRVASALRAEGFRLAVADMFRFPELCDLARWIRPSDAIEDETHETIAPFSLLGDGFDATTFCRDVAEQYSIGRPDHITDAFPCTPLQEGLMSLTLRRPGDYVARRILELDPTVEVGRLRSALGAISRAMPILRTRIVHHHSLDRGFAQIVLDEDAAPIMTATDGLDNYLAADRLVPMDLG